MRRSKIESQTYALNIESQTYALNINGNEAKQLKTRVISKES